MTRYAVQSLFCEGLSSFLAVHDEGLHGLKGTLKPTKYEDFAKTSKLNSQEIETHKDDNKLQYHWMDVVKDLFAGLHSPASQPPPHSRADHQVL